MSVFDTRLEQAFPTLTAAQVEAATRFASAPTRRFAPGETLYDLGDEDAPMWLVLEGEIEVLRKSGLDARTALQARGPGQFTGEVGQLSGRPALAHNRAGPGGCVALPFDAAALRALAIGVAEVGEIVVRALILRRQGLIEAGGAGSVIVGCRVAPPWLVSRVSSPETACPTRCWT